MPKAIKKRVKKKDVVATTDVAHRLSDIKDRLREKQKTLLTYGITAVVIALAVAGMLLYRYNADERARMSENPRSLRRAAATRRLMARGLIAGSR